MGDDEAFLKIVTCIVVRGAASLLASRDLSTDTMPHVPEKPITPLSEASPQLDMPTFIQAVFGPGQSLFTIYSSYFFFNLVPSEAHT